MPQGGGGGRSRPGREGHADHSLVPDGQGLEVHRLDAARPRERFHGRGGPHCGRHDRARQKGRNSDALATGGLCPPAGLPASAAEIRIVETGWRATYVLTMVVRTRSVSQIVVSNADYERLTDLANASMQRLPEVAEELLDELEHAKLVDAAQVPRDVVRMGSTVTFTSDDGHVRTLQLVYPADESLDDHRISVMTPVGAALIGLGVGQSISWKARDGRDHRLTVTKVG